MTFPNGFLSALEKLPMYRRIVCGIVLLVILFGVAWEMEDWWMPSATVGEPAETAVAPHIRFADLSDSDTLVCVDGVALTKKAAQEEARLKSAIYAGNNRLSVDDPRVKDFREACVYTAIPSFIACRLLVDEAARCHLVADTNLISRMRADLAKALQISEGGDFYARIARQTGTSPETVRRLVEQGALAETAQSRITAPPGVVSADVVSNKVSALQKVADMCAASNALQRATLRAALLDVTNGQDFAAVARRVSELHPEQGMLWDVFSSDDLALQIEDDAEAVLEWAFSAPVGSVSLAPVEMDDGVGLIKILSRTDGLRRAAVGAVQTAEVKLARIVVRAFDAPDVPSFDAMRAQLVQEATREARIKHNQALLLKATITYPNGTNLWPAAELKSETTSETTP